MRDNKTYEQCIEQACEDTIGSCNLGNSDLVNALEYWLEFEPREEDMVAAENYMAAQGICDCSVCGWITNDQDGPNGDMCSDCAEEENQ